MCFRAYENGFILRLRNKSALYRIQINGVALGLWTYTQTAGHRLCGPDV